MKIQQHYPLLHHNTFGMDQQCDEYLEFSSTADAVEAAAYIRDHADRPLLILGGGSNLLLTHDFQGLVVSPEQRFEVHAAADGKGNTLLRCWAGCTFDDVVAYAVAHQMYGLENLSLIPGQCGASAVQNIGAYGAEAKDTLVSVEAVEIATGQQVTIPADDCEYAYRQSRFKHEWRDKYLITWVVYRLSSVFSPRLDYGNQYPPCAGRRPHRSRYADGSTASRCNHQHTSGQAARSRRARQWRQLLHESDCR